MKQILLWTMGILFCHIVSAQGPVYALNLDGNSRYVRVSDNNTLDLSTSGTLMAWISISTYQNFAGIFHKGDATNNSDEAYSLIIDNNKDFAFTIRNNSTSKKIVASANFPLNTWIHVAAVWKSDSMMLIVNGVLKSYEISSLNVRNSSGALNIGAQFPTNVNATVKNYPFSGKMDEVKVFNTALSLEQIRQQMSRRLTSYSTNMVMYYNFDELSTLTIKDKTLNNNGVLTGYNLADSIRFKVVSGIPLGDNSVYSFGVNKPNLSISLLNRGSLNVVANSGITEGMILYHVFQPVLNAPLPAGIVKHDDTYWGMFVIGNSGAKYDVDYNFQSNTNVIDPLQMALISRESADKPWSNSGALLNTLDNKLLLNNLSNIQEFALAATAEGALPVELLSFKLKCTNTGSLISWATASETNNDYFTVEKTTDMKNWKVVTTVSGAFNSNNEISYDAVDSTMKSDQTTYYRLKQTDLDGKFKYFDVLSILCSFKNDELEIIGINVSDRKINTIFKTNGLSESNISLLDMNGKLISTHTLNPVKGANINSIEVENLKAGIYFITIVQNGEKATKKLYLH